MNKLDSYSIGQEIRRFRAYRDFTRSYMADALDIHINTYSKIENGLFKKLDLAITNSIAEILEIPVIKLLMPSEEKGQNYEEETGRVNNFISILKTARTESKELAADNAEPNLKIDKITPLIIDFVKATLSQPRKQEEN